MHRFFDDLAKIRNAPASLETTRRRLILPQRIYRLCKVFGIFWEHLRLADQPSANLRALKFSCTQQILDLLNVEKKVEGHLHIGHEPLILVGNHTSYLDIPLIMSLNPQCCFVAKQEVKSWPVIGKAGVKIDTIFVQRESPTSRKSVRTQIQEALLSGQKQLVIFPSGTTTLGPSRQWRRGAFEIAKSGNIRMQAFRLRYHPARAAAYIDQDFFPLHMLNLMKLPKVTAELEFGEVFHVNDVEKDLARIKTWCEDSEFKPDTKSSQESQAPRESGSYNAHDFL